MKVVAVIASIVISLFFLIPSFLPEDSGILKYLPGKRINLGLDLRGGIHVVLGVDVGKALDVELDHIGEQFRSHFEDEGLNLAELKRVDGERAFLVTLHDVQQSDALRKLLKDDFYQILMITNWDSDRVAKIKLEPRHEEYIQKMSLEQAREIIRNRVDEFGVAEPIIALEGSDRILVQLPGVSDPARAIQLIGKTALLEYKIVDEKLTPSQIEALVEEVRAKVGFTNNFTQSQLAALNQALKAKLPEGSEISFEKKTDPRSRTTNIEPYLLQAKIVLTGQALEDARVTTNQTNNQPQVSLKFNKQGAEEFEKITEDNVDKRLAILMDGVVISAPVIREKIPALSRGATISLGQGNHQQLVSEARDLALVLRSGALPAPVEVLENRTVGASLGADSIQKGKLSGLIAALAVVIFMLIYYRAGGLIADIAVSINILMLLAVMALFQATLTLPGIAGIVLTIGMAVDANVIILERIREELRSGNKKFRAALETGYEAAHKAILDSNLTTVIAGIVLFNFGSGPVKGFAVTLLIGVICNYICAFWFSRWISEYLLDRTNIKEISI
ncbi:MAG: protein translocase subunit SecD [Deltaproteobacteria bacterium CG11_big_fil_rev_8_21_14_0_20_45_16]|nr:MAG: protein translocase subunit SecD [Deltaproteobacteria bacterium CG11_big_fil_rev_8_21_14_0_20_45_16]